VVVAELHERGSSHTEIEVGGRISAELGPPVPIAGRVELHGPTTYSRAGTYMSGQVVDMGRVAVVHDRAGAVVLTERRIMPFDQDHLEVLGLDPARARVIVAKGATAWRAAFGAIEKQTIYVATPGFCPSNLSRLTYRHRPRPGWPPS
jgi:microcystin degradation protein MlrC